MLLPEISSTILHGCPVGVQLHSTPMCVVDQRRRRQQEELRWRETGSGHGKPDGVRHRRTYAPALHAPDQRVATSGDAEPSRVASLERRLPPSLPQPRCAPRARAFRRSTAAAHPMHFASPTTVSPVPARAIGLYKGLACEGRYDDPLRADLSTRVTSRPRHHTWSGSPTAPACSIGRIAHRLESRAPSRRR